MALRFSCKKMGQKQFSINSSWTSGNRDNLFEIIVIAKLKPITDRFLASESFPENISPAFRDFKSTWRVLETTRIRIAKKSADFDTISQIAPFAPIFESIMKLNFLIALFCLTHFASAQTVPTQYGPVTGHKNGTIYEFLGIPFASPPTGNFRWKSPIAPANWASFLADSFPPACPQRRYVQGDTTSYITGEEDCLKLNIWSPDTAANLPVMVFIHGGGNTQGSTGEKSAGTYLYHGKHIAERGGVVVVTIQYRLGVLGYMVHPGLELENTNRISGNYGVLDQIMALQWVQKNIGNFGGDAGNVTIFGESAGGVNVGNLLTTPFAKDLFHKAIIESAAPSIGTYSTNKTMGVDFVDSFVSTGSDEEKIQLMRKIPSDSLVMNDKSPLAGGLVQMKWQPVIDKYIFSDFPQTIFQSGNFNKVPLIIGSNADEMSLNAPAVVPPVAVTALIKTYVPSSLQSEAQSLYPAGSNSTEARESYVAILTDAQFTVSTRRTAACISRNQTEPVYRYFFTHRHTVPQLEQFGSYHGMELFYVFNTWEDATLGSGIFFKPADDSVQKNMLKYWTTFAKTGVLNEWPLYNSKTDCYMELKATPNSNNCGLRTEKCDLWDDAFGFTPCTASVNIDELNQSPEISIYPNPANGNIKIHFPGSETFKITFYTVQGQIAKSIEIKANTEIDISDLITGFYSVVINSDNNQFVGKLLKLYMLLGLDTPSLNIGLGIDVPSLISLFS
ncbi:MAG: carboxylesterase family protein [Bacteroidetes bacterium]|nr:carboxylesterase family protein [Bacteroidota bacterium]